VKQRRNRGIARKERAI